ncbi:Uncharacterized protein OBRU01_23228 [Operophtera brumata]|uniref:FLYWCH-type domain-containing protein n=1 Tax=Operophtera brumata TaxID=104452 RepID=A0A0L7KQ49_OPEBR|nr:Uncharacterized protein OBRU01_23228 [Operophtera brumata]
MTGEMREITDSVIFDAQRSRRNYVESIANFVPTTKGSMLLVHDGYAFRLKNKLAYGKKQWYCTGRPKLGCNVDVTTALHKQGSNTMLNF